MVTLKKKKEKKRRRNPGTKKEKIKFKYHDVLH